MVLGIPLVLGPLGFLPGTFPSLRRPVSAADPPETRFSLEPAIVRSRAFSIVDGDTIVVSPNERVRFVGVDAPKQSIRQKPSNASVERPRSSREE
jgi:endonuclease YncB( thermonuclease family)